MAIKLEDKPNTEAPSVAYPYGAVKDNTGANDGTPVNKLVYDDFHQFFAKMMAASAIAYNDLPDNETDGFQYFLALVKVIQDTISADVTVMGADSAVKLKRKIVNIGDWNMDTTANITVAHGLADFTKIRSIEAYIIDDTSINIYPIDMAFTIGTPVTAVQGTIGSITTTTVSLYRLTGGTFDGINFNSTSFNRGWIHIIYEA